MKARATFLPKLTAPIQRVGAGRAASTTGARGVRASQLDAVVYVPPGYQGPVYGSGGNDLINLPPGYQGNVYGRGGNDVILYPRGFRGNIYGGPGNDYIGPNYRW